MKGGFIMGTGDLYHFNQNFKASKMVVEQSCIMGINKDESQFAGYRINNDERQVINPLTVRTAIWRLGLISSCGSNRMIILNFYCKFYHPMRLS